MMASLRKVELNKRHCLMQRVRDALREEAPSDHRMDNLLVAGEVGTNTHSFTNIAVQRLQQRSA
jgi:hypothetical protein